MSIDVANPADRHVIEIETEPEEILNYKDLTIEIQRTWDVKAKVMPVIIWRLERFQNSSDST